MLICYMCCLALWTLILQNSMNPLLIKSERVKINKLASSAFQLWIGSVYK